MLQGILEADPAKRWTTAQVASCAWMQGPMASEGDMQKMMAARKAKCDEDSANERAQRAAEKL